MKLLNKVKYILLITFFIVLIFAGKSFAVTGVITEITVNLRKEPSTTSKKIMYVTQDDVVEVLEKVGDWYKIKFEGKTGYVFGTYINVDDSKLKDTTETVEKEELVEENSNQEVINNENEEKDKDKEQDKIQEENTEKEELVVLDTNLIIKNKTQVRIIPNISSSIIYSSKNDIKINIIEQLKDWTYISVDNITGWVRTDNIVEANEVLPDKKEDNVESKKEEITETKTAYVKHDKVNLRKKASTNATVLAKLKLNDKVTVLEEVDSKWSKVKVNGKTGYISTELLADEKQEVKEETKNEEITETKISYIKYDKVNLRKKASTNAAVLAKLKLNDKVTVLEEVDSKWSKVKVDGITGYISTELLSDKKQEVKEAEKNEENTTSRDSQTTSRNDQEDVKETNNKKEEVTTKQETTSENEETKKEEDKEVSTKTTGEDIVNYAKKYLGYKYVYGGSTPKGGFDCSGFTKYVYNHFGYTLSRSSTAQAKNGKKVSKDELEPGDLLIFKNQALTKIGHVGIYIGNNKMIHASEPGIGVVITDLNASGYNYNKRYVTARRIIN